MTINTVETTTLEKTHVETRATLRNISSRIDSIIILLSYKSPK